MGSIKKSIYLAAPLFNDSEREYNLRLADHLEPFADVFLPQRDGRLMKELLKDGWTLRDARNKVYQEDIKAINECDILIAVLDGRVIDEGVAFELGYARALGRICLGLKTDDRALLATGDNPMIVMGCHKLFADFDTLITAVSEFSTKGDSGSLGVA